MKNKCTHIIILLLLTLLSTPVQSKFKVADYNKDKAKEIIDKYAYHRKKAAYLFPIFDARVHKTPQQKANRIHKVCAQINRELKELAQELEISDNLTTYVARHSFATILKRSGVDIALISELMGHSDLTTTQIYLDSFDEEQINTAMQHLV